MLPLAAQSLITVPLTELRACPHCDALHRMPQVNMRERAVCERCGSVLIAPRADAFTRIFALAATSLILMTAAVFMPFLDLSASGLHNRASVLDAALAFSEGAMVPLSVAVAALIVLIPVLRAFLVIYVLAPVVFDRKPWPGAIAAFRFSETLKPWSMAEIFVIGVAVALVKISDLARVDYGPAFWMFAALVLVITVQDGYMCRWSVWKSLDKDTHK